MKHKQNQNTDNNLEKNYCNIYHNQRVDLHKNKELENLKKNQAELKNTITEIENTLKGINSRLDDTVEWISKIEERAAEITQPEQRKKERERKKECF